MVISTMALVLPYMAMASVSIPLALVVTTSDAPPSSEMVDVPAAVAWAVGPGSPVPDWMATSRQRSL